MIYKILVTVMVIEIVTDLIAPKVKAAFWTWVVGWFVTRSTAKKGK